MNDILVSVPLFSMGRPIATLSKQTLICTRNSAQKSTDGIDIGALTLAHDRLLSSLDIRGLIFLFLGYGFVKQNAPSSSRVLIDMTMTGNK